VRRDRFASHHQRTRENLAGVFFLVKETALHEHCRIARSCRENVDLMAVEVGKQRDRIAPRHII
jgi:hypothetical protein